MVPRGRDSAVLGRRTPARRAAARLALGYDDSVLLLAVARHEYQKGLDVLLEGLPAVLAAQPGVVLLVAGRPGNQTAELEATTARHRLGGSVRLLGTRSDVPELLCAADVFVLASRREGFPGAVLEAIALELRSWRRTSRRCAKQSAPGP